jgi:hypothetical protein
MLPTISERITAAAIATQIPHHGGILLTSSSIIVAYAPMPKKAEWPTEYWPVYPPITFHACPWMMARKSITPMCRM